MVEIYTNHSENITLPESDLSQELQELRVGVEGEPTDLEKNLNAFKTIPLLGAMLPLDKISSLYANIQKTFAKIDAIFSEDAISYKYMMIVGLLLCSSQEKCIAQINSLNGNNPTVFPGALNTYLNTLSPLIVSLEPSVQGDSAITYEKILTLLKQKQEQEKKSTGSTIYSISVYDEMLKGCVGDGMYAVPSNNIKFNTVNTPGLHKGESKEVSTAQSYGKYFAPDGGFYEGQIVVTKIDELLSYRIEGQGTYTWPNGSTYVGQWENGIPNGVSGELKYITNSMSRPIQQIQLNGSFAHGFEPFTGTYIDGEGVVHNNVAIETKFDRANDIDILTLKEGEKMLPADRLNPSIVKTYPIQLALQKREEKADNASLQTSEK